MNHPITRAATGRSLITRSVRALGSAALGAAALAMPSLGAALATPHLTAQGGGLGAYIASLPLEPLSQNETALLVQLRMEEKLARDVYTTLYQTWGIPVFDRIASSEQSHMDLVGTMLTRYGIPDPLTSQQVGVFSDPFFDAVYQGLTAFGRFSQLHALVAGALIEDLDIADLDVALALSDNRDLDTVWQNLQLGSRNHMRSFYRQLSNSGFVYLGIYLPTARITAIVSSPQEVGSVDENGLPLP